MHNSEVEYFRNINCKIKWYYPYFQLIHLPISTYIERKIVLVQLKKGKRCSTVALLH